MAGNIEELRAAAQQQDTGLLEDLRNSLLKPIASAMSGAPRLRYDALMENPEVRDLDKLKYARDFGDVPAEETPLPDTLGTATGTAAVDSIPWAIGLGVLAQRVPAINGANRLRTAVQNAVNGYGNVFKANPMMAVSTETVLGGASGAGGFGMSNVFPDLPGSAFIGEVLGGSGGNLALAGSKRALNLVPSKYLFNKVDQWFSPEGATARAGSRLQAVGDPSLAVQGLADTNLSPNSRLTVSQRTGQQGYMDLEKTIIEEAKDGHMSQQYMDDLAATNRALYDDVRIEGDRFATSDAYEAKLGYYNKLVQGRIQIAAQRAQRRTEQLAPRSQTREALDTFVYEELDIALRDARKLENELYAQIPKDMRVPANLAVVGRRQILESLPQAQLDDMPSASKFFDPKSAAYKSISKDGNVSIFELRGVQSKLRAEARANRAGESPNYNKARLADDLADLVTEDISNLYIDDPNANTVAAAVAFSRELNQKFSRGTVARVFRRQASGSEAIDPSRTLTATLGVGNGKNKVAYDQILTAVEGKPEVQAAMEDYIRFNFFRGAEFDPVASQRFLNSNADLMNRLPVLKREVQGAIRSGDSAKLLAGRSSPFNNPKWNKAVLFIEKTPEVAFNDVISSRSPAKEMRKLVQYTDADETGEAFTGLKSSFTNMIMNQATTTSRAADGSFFLDGAKLGDILGNKETKQAMIALFSRDERARFDRVLRTAKKLDLARTAGTFESTMEGSAGFLGNIISRVIGARAGRFVSQGKDIQTPALFSQAFQRLANAGVVNPSRQLLEDAIGNEELFKALLEVKTDKRGLAILSEKNRSVINAWAANSLMNLGQENEEAQQQQPPQQ
jgi:hypothetical protein